MVLLDALALLRAPPAHHSFQPATSATSLWPTRHWLPRDTRPYIILMLRNPVSRCVSSYYHFVQTTALELQARRAAGTLPAPTEQDLLFLQFAGRQMASISTASEIDALLSLSASDLYIEYLAGATFGA